MHRAPPLPLPVGPRGASSAALARCRSSWRSVSPKRRTVAGQDGVGGAGRAAATASAGGQRAGGAARRLAGRAGGGTGLPRLPGALQPAAEAARRAAGGRVSALPAAAPGRQRDRFPRGAGTTTEPRAGGPAGANKGQAGQRGVPAHDPQHHRPADERDIGRIWEASSLRESRCHHHIQLHCHRGGCLRLHVPGQPVCLCRDSSACPVSSNCGFGGWLG